MTDLASTNSELINKYGTLLYDLVDARVESIIKLNAFDRPMREYVSQGYTDPIRIFIKAEPHKLKKMNLKRYRIISSVSVIDQVIDRFLYGEQCESEVMHWNITPSKAGTGLSTDEQQQQLYRILKALHPQLVTSDVSGWDWNFKAWQFWAEYIRTLMVWGYDFEYAYDCAYAPNFANMTPAVKLAWFRTQFLSYNYFGLSDGTLLTHGPPGIQKSGSLKTLSSNSSQRSLLALLVFGEDANAMGDDAIEAWHRSSFDPDLFTAEYLTWGFILTDVKLVKGDEPLDFCSHLLYSDRAVPANQAKMTFKYLHSHLKDTVEQKLQITTDLRYAPDGDFIMQFLRSRWLAWANDISS